MNQIRCGHLALIVTAFLCGVAWADDVISEIVEHHPAGPVNVREWRHEQGGVPFRIEISRARSGITLVGQTRLQRTQDGRWLIITPTGTKLLLVRGLKQHLPVSLSFIDAKQLWNIRVNHQEVPVDVTGVSQESEPSLNVVLKRR